MFLVAQVVRKFGLEAAFSECANEISDDALVAKDGLLGVVCLEDLIEQLGREQRGRLGRFSATSRPPAVIPFA